MSRPHHNGVRRDERVLPHNLDAEASILGGVILRNEVLGELADLEVDDFYDLRHKIVFAAIRALEATGRPIDIVMLEDEITKQGKLDAIGGVAFLGELQLRVPTADNVVAYTDLVKLHHRNRTARLVLSSALERVKTWPHDPIELVSEVAGELQRLETDHGMVARSRRARWTIPLDEFLGDEEPDDDDAEDWIIRDIVPRGEPFLWGGPMKGGKTWAALDLCICVALGVPWLGKFDNTLRRPAKVLGLFLEDNKRRLRKRLWELCRAHGCTPNNELLRENLRISRAPLRLPDKVDQRRLVTEAKEFGAQLIVADNLTRVMIGDPNSTREASAFTKAWVEINDETGASVGFLHHTKKPTGDMKQIDPFDLLRGSGDFGAAARNVVVSMPLRSDGAAEKLSEVRMRGNLDLRRESFMLGFSRGQHLDRWHARLADRGEVEEVREEVKKGAKEERAAKKKAEIAAELEQRRNKAVELARTERYVTQQRLATEFGLKSPRAMADVLNGLVSSGVLREAGKRGYELADADRQEGLL